MPGKPWTAGELIELERLFPCHSNKELAEMFPGRSWTAIGEMGKRNGWKKTYYLHRSMNRGYVMIKCPDHPHCDKDGYVREHRLVMERVLGRYLLPNEDVHHINRITTDNRPENLQVMTKREHSAHHQTGVKRSPEMRAKMSRLLYTRYEDKQIDAEDLKAAVLTYRTVSEISASLGISLPLFYRRIRMLGLGEWYRSVKQRAWHKSTNAGPLSKTGAALSMPMGERTRCQP